MRLSAAKWLAFMQFDRSKKKFIKMGFSDMKRHAATLAESIYKSKGRPGAIIYIRRGGMVIARLLSDMLGVKNLVGISASYYTDVGKPASSISIGEIPEFNSNGYLLLVDDIADTGKTLKEVKKRLEEKTNAEIVTCTLVAKQRSEIMPDFYVQKVDNDTWVVFDYEENETLESFKRSNNELGLKFMRKHFARK